MNNPYGHFTEKGDAFVVTRFDTPQPWTNYLTNGDYCAIVSSTGGGMSFYKSHHANMIIRREQRNVLTDKPGRYVYIRDNETGEYWSANVMPVKKAHDFFEAEHGMGYTKISSSTLGIESALKFFVPIGFDGEILKVKLQNVSGKKRDLSVFFYEELELANSVLQAHERQFASMFQNIFYEDGAICGEQGLWDTVNNADAVFKSTKTWPYRVFVKSTVKEDAFETSQERFIGVHREVNDPIAVEQNTMSSLTNIGYPACAALCWHVTLSEGEAFETEIVTGISEKETVKDAMKKVDSSEKIQKLEADTAAYWENYLSPIRIETPDEAINRNFNYWNKYQLFMNFSYGRGPSYYHVGQSMGMRDSFQDAFGMIPLAPEKAKEQIKRVASFIFSDGSPCDVTSRVEYKANKGDKVDVPLWLALAFCNYLKETNDWDALDEVVPYLDGGEGTLYEHILKGIGRIAREPGIHGLPLFGGGDWNDSLNRIGHKGRGESVWLGQFIYYCINEIKPILLYKKDEEMLKQFEKIASDLQKAHEEHCWDGEWFIIGFNDDHKPVGTKEDRVGSVYLNTQTWAAISEISSRERLEKAMDSVDKYLETDFGMALISPAFDHLDDGIGICSAFAPGLKENGAIFSHATAFNLVGKAKLGRGNDLYRVYKKTLPSEKPTEIYKVEPYIYSQFCAGPGAQQFGRGSFHWMTGTAAWMFRVVLDYMTGIQSDYNGLKITPCINEEWDEYTVYRRYRGCDYTVHVTNPNHVQTGVKQITVDGEAIEGDTVLSNNKTCHVEVVMG